MIDFTIKRSNKSESVFLLKKIIRLLSNNNKIKNMPHFCCLSNKEDGKNVDTIYMLTTLSLATTGLIGTVDDTLYLTKNHLDDPIPWTNWQWKHISTKFKASNSQIIMSLFIK